MSHKITVLSADPLDRTFLKWRKKDSETIHHHHHHHHTIIIIIKIGIIIIITKQVKEIYCCTLYCGSKTSQGQPPDVPSHLNSWISVDLKIEINLKFNDRTQCTINRIKCWSTLCTFLFFFFFLPRVAEGSRQSITSKSQILMYGSIVPTATKFPTLY